MDDKSIIERSPWLKRLCTCAADYFNISPDMPNRMFEAFERLLNEAAPALHELATNLLSPDQERGLNTQLIAMILTSDLYDDVRSQLTTPLLFIKIFYSANLSRIIRKLSCADEHVKLIELLEEKNELVLIALCIGGFQYSTLNSSYSDKSPSLPATYPMQRLGQTVMQALWVKPETISQETVDLLENLGLFDYAFPASQHQ